MNPFLIPINAHRVKMALFRRLAVTGPSLLIPTRSIQLLTPLAARHGGRDAVAVLALTARFLNCHFSQLSGALGVTQPKSKRNILLPRTCASGLLLVPCSCIHIQGDGGAMLAASKEKVPGSKSGGQPEHGSVLMQFVEKKEEPKQLTVGAKAVQASKDFSYLLVILGGFAVTGFLLWSVSSEFFSSTSPQTIFTKALKRVKADPRVIEVLGEPITGHGDESGRGRRRHIANQEYEVEGVSYMRMKFYVDGSKRKGIVYLDLKKNDQGKYECRFLFVELKGYPSGTIIIEDNR